MSIADVNDLRAVVDTDRTDDQIATLLDRLEDELELELGSLQTEADDVELTETRYPSGSTSVFLKQPIGSVTSVTEDDVALETTSYRVRADQGVIERLPVGGEWGEEVVVVYKPLARLPIVKSVEVRLAQLELARSGFKAESVAGEYSYTGLDDYETERKKLMKRLRFVAY